MRKCGQCGSNAVKKVRGKAGMLALGVFAPKTMEKCNNCGHRQPGGF